MAANAQRGSYSGSSAIVNGIKENLSGASQGINNRFGGENSIPDNINPNFVPFYTQNSYNHNQLANRLDQLPQSQQPFWYVNKDYISNYLNNPPPQNSGQLPFVNRGSFMGKRR